MNTLDKTTHATEGLRHLAQKVFGDLHGLVDGQVAQTIRQVLLDPARDLAPLVRTGKPLYTERKQFYYIK